MQVPIEQIQMNSTSSPFAPSRMMTAPAPAAKANSITLSFNGVDFCLTPGNNGNSNLSTAGITITPNKDGSFTTIQMDSFTGCLSVSLSTNSNETGASTCTSTGGVVSPVAPAVPPPMSSATVEDEGSTSGEDDNDIRGYGLSQKESKSKKDKNTAVSLKGQQQLPFEKKKRVLSDISTDHVESAAPTKDVSLPKKKTKKVNHTTKKRRSESTTKSSAGKTATTASSEQEGVVERKDVSSLLGQSMMLSQESCSSVSRFENINDMMLSETIASQKKNDDALLLKRKISIQELVGCGEDLTQTQRLDHDEDYEMSSMSQGGHNTIVEIDEMEETQLASNVTSLMPSPKTYEEALLGPSKKSINLPRPRWGSTMNMIEDDKILVYGGQGVDPKTNDYTTFNDVYVYDLIKKTWSQPVNCVGMPRTWHTSTYLPDRTLLISFGGEKYNPKTKKVQTTDQVMVLDTEIMLWYPPAVSGQIPSGRSGHTATLLSGGKELVVFGGVKNSKWQNSAAVLNTDRWRWRTPKIAGDAPKPRSYHSATAVPSSDGSGCKLVIFGGNNDSESFNSVHVLDVSGEDENLSWSHPSVCGTPPSPRTGHCATLLEDDKTILISGGWDPMDDDDESAGNDEAMMCDDSFLLDTETWTWKPGPKSEFVDYCGAENLGTKRTGAQSLLVPGTGDSCSRVLVFGGRGPKETFANDFQSITVSQQMIDAAPIFKL